MITWFQVWPLLTIPYLAIFGAGLLPFVREYLLNNLLIPIIPYDSAVKLVDWYQSTNLAGELVLHFLISLNLGTLAYPFFYLIGHLFISLTNHFAKSQIKSLNQT